LPGIGDRHGDHFSQTTVHEGYKLNMTSEMLDVDVFNLKIKLLYLEEEKHSVADNSQLNFCFPPGFIPTTGPYALQRTDLTKQMAGNKRSHKDGDDFVPETKRRLTFNGQGVKNNNTGKLHLRNDSQHQNKSTSPFNVVHYSATKITSNTQVAAPLSKSFTKDNHHGTQKAVIIDLSDDEEHRIHNLMQPAKAIMKPLPQGSMTEDFPRFNSGTVYIMIDPKIRTYQYCLHKVVLSRVSPVFAKALQQPCPKEAMEKYKVATNNDIGARFELFYSFKLRQWKLLRGVSYFLINVRI
jgi:hypothetical protein